MSRFLLLLAALLLLVPGWAESLEADQTLERYLERAESEGIIEKAQVPKLLLLARTMNLVGGSNMPVAPQESYDSAEQKSSMFMHVYNHLTLLNLLYMSGAVIIMGAYSLFMTLAYEQCNHAALSLIMLVQLLVFGGFGVVLWRSVEYAYAGGM